MTPTTSRIDDYESDGDSELTYNNVAKELSEEPVGVGFQEREAVAKAFMKGLICRSKPSILRILAVHTKTDGRKLSSISRAKIATFNIHRQLIANQCGGDANMQRAWFGGTKNQLCRILSLGFCGPTIAAGGIQFGHGVGVYLSPLKFPIDYIGSSTPDDNGIRYMLLCRVILGKTEVITPGSTQSFPSSEGFHSGVDNSSNPRRFVIWCCNMNTHILPEFILCFRLPSSTGNTKRPSSPFVTFDNLLPMLGNVLDSREMTMISKFYDDFKNKQLPRCQLIRKIRQIAGDGVLKSIIGSCYRNINPSLHEQSRVRQVRMKLKGLVKQEGGG